MKKIIIWIVFLFLTLTINAQINPNCWDLNDVYLSPLNCPEDFGYTLVFEDNFDGTNLDLSKWQIQPYQQGATHNPNDMTLEYNSTDNVTIANGLCYIVAKNRRTSTVYYCHAKTN